MNKNLVKRLPYEHLRNEAHVAYHETFNGLVQKHDPDRLGIRPLYDAYLPLYMVEVSVLDLIRKSGHTEEIDGQDRLRDSLIHGFTDAVKSARNHFDVEMQKAAKKIELTLKHYGNIAVKPLDQETAAIDDLLRELSDKHEADVRLLMLDDWLRQLDAANQKFKELMSERYAETAQRPSTNMKTARVGTDRAFRAILNMLDSLITVNGASQYEPFVNELNAVSERYKTQLAQSAGRRKDKTEDK
jgi:hypothetical protein